MNNELEATNPFLEIDNPRPLGPGTFEMALPLVNSTKIRKGMRVLEVGAGTGQVAAALAKYWDVTVVAIEPMKVGRIRTHADLLGVSNQVLPLRAKAQSLPFGKDAFDAVISIGTFEMIGEERPQALAEMIRVARPGAYIGIAEPMCLTENLPSDLAQLEKGKEYQQNFRTLDWNVNLFASHGLDVTEQYYFPDAYNWWVKNEEKYGNPSSREFIEKDKGRWLSLGLVVGVKNSVVRTPAT